MRQDIPPAFLFIVGSIVTVLMITTGLVLISWEERNNKKFIMELIYFFAALGAISLGILIYSLVSIHKEKRSQKV